MVKGYKALTIKSGTAVLSQFKTGLNVFMYKDSKILKSRTLLQLPNILKSSVLMGEEEQAFAWLRMREWDESETGALAAMLCESRVRNTNVFVCIVCIG